MHIFQSWVELVQSVVGLWQDNIVAALQVFFAKGEFTGILTADAVTVLSEELLNFLDALGYWLLVRRDVLMKNLQNLKKKKETK